MPDTITFEDRRARTYRKRAEVLAFRADAPCRFDKSWGRQELRAGAWVIVPLTVEGSPTTDVYGCDADVFARTYEPSPSLRPNQYRKRETVRAYQPGHSFQVDTVLADGHVEVGGARADSFDAWIVKAKSGEVYPVEDAEFRRTYVEVLERTDGYRPKTRDQHWAADGSPKRILALDGGGVRGILTLGYLERIETLLRARHGESSEFRLCHYFDLIAGTSTGAIIAACLAKGMSVAQVRDRYEKLARRIFARAFWRRGLLLARYRVRALAEALQDVFEGNTLGSTSIQTGLLVVAKRIDTGSVWPMSNNPGSRFFKARPQDPFLSNEDYPLNQVIRASTAAPSYFAPERILISREKERPQGEFVDGGMSPHNNPALLALQLVAAEGFGACWPLDPDKLLLVSVGTGAGTPGVRSKRRTAIEHAFRCLLSMMDDCAEAAELMLQWLSDSPTARSIDAAFGSLERDLLVERPLLQYLRYNVHFDPAWLSNQLDRTLDLRRVEALEAMDEPGNMPQLSELGRAAAERQVRDSHFPASFDLS